MMIIINFLKRLHLVYYTLMIFIAFILINPVLADINLDNTQKIEMGRDYIFHLKNLKTGDLLDMEFEVTSGDAVDIFLVNAINYDWYQNGEIVDIVRDENAEKVIAQNVTKKKFHLVIDKDDDYYLIVENSNMYGLADPTGPVNIHTIITVSTQDDTGASIETSTSTRTAKITETIDAELSSTAISNATAGPDSNLKTPGFEFFTTVFILCLIYILRRR